MEGHQGFSNDANGVLNERWMTERCCETGWFSSSGNLTAKGANNGSFRDDIRFLRSGMLDQPDRAFRDLLPSVRDGGCLFLMTSVPAR